MLEPACGAVKVVAGPMGAGKTHWLVRWIHQYVQAGATVVLVTSTVDTREERSVTRVLSASAPDVADRVRSVRVERVGQAAQVAGLQPSAAVWAIDEGQFFDADLDEGCAALADAGATVLVSALDTNWRREPFAHVARLMAGAESCQKLAAICATCKRAAAFTARSAPVRADAKFVVGDAGYHPACRGCHTQPASEE